MQINARGELTGLGRGGGVLGAAGEYEVYSAFIRGTADVLALEPSIAAEMQGTARAAYYFVLPAQNSCSTKVACVAEDALFSLISRMEANGVATCWPHPSRLHRELSGKLWELSWELGFG